MRVAKLRNTSTVKFKHCGLHYIQGTQIRQNNHLDNVRVPG